MTTRTIPATRIADLVGDFDREPAYRGLAEAIRVLITDGRIPVGVRLPSERTLTEALRVSRTTVARAYADLRERGFLSSRQGSGSVAALPRGRNRLGDRLLPAPAENEDADLTCAAPTPPPGILAAYQRAVARLPSYLTGSGYYPTGLPALREAVAENYRRRGLPTDPDQILIVPGAQAGVSLAAHALAGRGRRVLLESPTYPNATGALRATGARLFGVDVDPDAPDAGELVRSVAQLRPDLAYLIPDFHNPTGHLLSAAGREALGAALRAAGTTAIVDESMVDLVLDPIEVPGPMALFAPGTITVGSMSKPFWGGLRVGWLRAPAGAVDALIGTRLSLDLGVPVLEQLVAVDLLEDPAPLLAHRRDALRESRDALAAALTERLPQWRFRIPAGGMNLWCRLPEPRSSDLADRAADLGVVLVPGPTFAPEGGLDRFLRLPYTQSADVLTGAVDRIASAWERTAPGVTRTRRTGPTLVA